MGEDPVSSRIVILVFELTLTVLFHRNNRSLARRRKVPEIPVRTTPLKHLYDSNIN